jgi:hypothetical protein
VPKLVNRSTQVSHVNETKKSIHAEPEVREKSKSPEGPKLYDLSMSMVAGVPSPGTTQFNIFPDPLDVSDLYPPSQQPSKTERDEAKRALEELLAQNIDPTKIIEPSARKIETQDSTLPVREAIFVDYEPDNVNLMESYNDDTRPIRIQGETIGKDANSSNELRTKLYHDSPNERGRTTGRY